MTMTFRIRKLAAAAALIASAALVTASPASADDGSRLAYEEATFFDDFDPSRYDYRSLEAAGCIDAYGNIDRECAETYGTEVQEEASTAGSQAPAESGGDWAEVGAVRQVEYKDAPSDTQAAAAEYAGSIPTDGVGSSAGSGVNVSTLYDDARGVVAWVRRV